MSYALYRDIKDIEAFMTETQYGVDGRDMTNEVIFRTFVLAFNKIADLVRYNRRLPFFNLKHNWALIKSQDFEEALANLKEWVQMTDDRYDGENWNE